MSVGGSSVLHGDSDDDGEPNTYDYNDSFIDDREENHSKLILCACYRYIFFYHSANWHCLIILQIKVVLLIIQKTLIGLLLLKKI